MDGVWGGGWGEGDGDEGVGDEGVGGRGGGLSWGSWMLGGGRGAVVGGVAVEGDDALVGG